jgi:serine/threonine protein kinase
MYKIVNEGIPPLPDDISTELKNFLNSCFIRKTKQRKTAAELLSHPWVPQSTEKDPKPNVELEEEDLMAVPIVSSDIIARGHKHNNREAHKTQIVHYLLTLRLIPIKKKIGMEP